MWRVLLITIGILCPALSAPAQVLKRTLNASRLTGNIVVDGKLNEREWQGAETASEFTQIAPNPGDASRRKTKVSVLYDNDAIYVGAFLYDEPDSILKQLSPRDVYGDQSTDVFGVTFDTYNDHQNATEFDVTAAGVQADAIIKFDGGNGAWNAAWYSKVSYNDSGWCVEMKIPYSALRFPKKAEQVWGLNFFRVIRRYRERSYWNAISPIIPNGLDQSGTLNGIRDIKAPIRLSLLPYISAYAENYAGVNTNTVNGGMDIKYGINESFTLDMTLVPDFGQTIYDNRVLNLSPIEVRYDDRRYFFTEGLDIFNKNDLFYSRRVGGAPVNYGSPPGMLVSDTIVENPAATRLYNATKISGRTKKNLGIGFFNAVSESTYATVKDSAGNLRHLQTAPLTNYNVIVLDQALKNNSYISVINTNVNRQQGSYNADVSAVLFKFANKANTYGVNGSADMSQLYYSTKPDLGYRYYLNFGKISGNYTCTFSARTISDHFNPNDLGYLDRNNITYYLLDQYYNIYKPVGPIVSAYNHFGIDCYRVFNPDVFQQADIFGSHNVTFPNYLTVGFYWTLQPFENYDYNEPRTFGRYCRIPRNYMAGGFYSSDYRKKFALDLQFTERGYAERSRNILSWSISPRYRFNDKFSVIYSISGQFDKDDVGYVDKISDTIFFGIRNVNYVTNSLDAAYIFNSKMSLKLDARHYWAQPVYSQYATLKDDGTLGPTSYNTSHDINFNSFNVYTSLVWQFLPGSEMSIVYQNSIYSSGQNVINNYLDDLSNTFRAQQSNSLSVKVIYYLDYQMMKHALGRS